MAEDKAIKTNKTVSDHAAFVQSVKASLNTAKAKTSGLRQTPINSLWKWPHRSLASRGRCADFALALGTHMEPTAKTAI